MTSLINIIIIKKHLNYHKLIMNSISHNFTPPKKPKPKKKTSIEKPRKKVKVIELKKFI